MQHYIIFIQEVTIACYDFLFAPSAGSVSNTQEFGCVTEDCDVTRVWNMTGVCKDPTLYVSIIETDYSSSSHASIIVEDDSLGTCDELDADCTYERVDCSNADGFDLSSYIDNSQRSSDQYFGVTLTSRNSNICNCKYNGIHTLYGSVTVECGGYQLNLIVQLDTMIGSRCDVIDDVYWSISFTTEDGIEYGTILSGNGTLDSAGRINQTLSIIDGCYEIEFSTTRGDDEIDYGWFELYLDSKLISHGKQKMITENEMAYIFIFVQTFLHFYIIIAILITAELQSQLNQQIMHQLSHLQILMQQQLIMKIIF